MKIIHYSRADARIFDAPPARGVTGRVVIGKADGAQNFCMRVFELAPGGHTPLHTHDWEHEIFVHSGKARVFQEGNRVEVETGSVLFIPANEQHQLENTGSEPVVFVCLIPSGAPEI